MRFCPPAQGGTGPCPPQTGRALTVTPQPDLAQRSLRRLPPGRDQRHVLPGRATSCLWRHVGTPLWSTWVSKAPGEGSGVGASRRSPAGPITCVHFSAVCGHARTETDGETRGWGRQCLLRVGGRMLLRRRR